MLLPIDMAKHIPEGNKARSMETGNRYQPLFFPKNACNSKLEPIPRRHIIARTETANGKVMLQPDAPGVTIDQFVARVQHQYLADEYMAARRFKRLPKLAFECNRRLRDARWLDA